MSHTLSVACRIQSAIGNRQCPLPTIVGKGLVGLGHLVRVVALLHRSAQTVGGIHQFGIQCIGTPIETGGLAAGAGFSEPCWVSVDMPAGSGEVSSSSPISRYKPIAAIPIAASPNLPTACYSGRKRGRGVVCSGLKPRHAQPDTQSAQT